MAEEIKNNLRWLLIRDAFEGQSTPDCYLIGHAFMKPETDISPKDWESFSDFCNMCDVVASLRNQGVDRMSCLSLWQTYEVNTAY
ncbi:hypothetical protein LCGC14_0844080 [marine sediment metagenome]|uniref:Uncharacterized protein n=1 Tax=marine sediment metagenome TaxID=412755 RepID=A0A0F9SJC5_9ZZZZ